MPLMPQLAYSIWDTNLLVIAADPTLPDWELGAWDCGEAKWADQAM